MPRFLPMSIAALLVATPVLSESFRLWDLSEHNTITAPVLQQRISAIFVEFDKDGDGALDSAEYDAFDAARKAEAEEHKTSMALRAQTGLSRSQTDLNFDGKVTREEMAEAVRNWFTSMDRNGDGQIDDSDFPNALDFTKEN